MRRLTLSALAVGALLATSACQNRDGSTNWGNTLLLGGAAGLGTAAVLGAMNDDQDNRRDQRRYDRQRYRESYYNNGYGYGSGGYGRGRPRGYYGY